MSSPQIRDLMLRIFPGLLVLFSFTKLPATIIADKSPQSWEAVLSFAVSHHLVNGDVTSFSPTDRWDFLDSRIAITGAIIFWIILFWSFGFALLLTVLVMRFLERIPSLVRIAICLALP